MNSLPDMIRSDLIAAGYTVKSAAEAMKVNRSNFHMVLAGKANVRRELAYRLSILINPDDQTFAYARRLLTDQFERLWKQEAEQRDDLMATIHQNAAKANMLSPVERSNGEACPVTGGSVGVGSP